MSISSRYLYLLTLPALGLGWLVGGSPRTGAPLPETPPTKTESRTTGEIVPSLPDFHEAQADGTNPSFVEVSLRILRHADQAGDAELARLWHEVYDARYETHAGYELVRIAVNEIYRERLPERYLAELTTAHARQSFLRDWGARDMRAAFAAALQVPPPGFRAIFLSAALDDGAQKDPDAAMELIRSIPDAELRESVAYRAVTAAARKNPDSFAALAAEFPMQAASIYHEAFGQLARKNPKEAIAKLEDVSPACRELARTALIEGWATSDYAAAFRWATDHGAMIPEHLFHQWMRSDPVPALESALESSLGGRVESAFGGGRLDETMVSRFEHLIANASAERRDDVAGWLAGIEDESLRARLTSGLFAGDDEPSAAVLEAARFAAGHPNRKLEKLRQLVARIPDAKERREWIQSLPTPVARGQMAIQAGGWLGEDRAGFAAYVEALPTVRAKRTFMQNAVRNDHENSDALKSFAEERGIQWNPNAP